MSEEEKSSGISVQDFYIPQKVDAFCSSYLQAATEAEADEVYTDTRLRTYFQAYPRTYGDTLIPYMENLETRGWKMKTSMSGEAALFCKLLPTPGAAAMLDYFDSE